MNRGTHLIAYFRPAVRSGLEQEPEYGTSVRIWDVDPALLCRSHLLGEHRELHGLWNILTRGLTGYSRHPETRRWEGRLAALYRRHEALVAEMTRRGYRHHSPLDPSLATGSDVQDVFVDPPAAQHEILRAKDCACFQSR